MIAMEMKNSSPVISNEMDLISSINITPVAPGYFPLKISFTQAYI